MTKVVIFKLNKNSSSAPSLASSYASSEKVKRWTDEHLDYSRPIFRLHARMPASLFHGHDVDDDDDNDDGGHIFTCMGFCFRVIISSSESFQHNLQHLEQGSDH